MLDKVWSYMIIISIVCAFFTGKTNDVSVAIFEGAASGVSLAISLLGGMCLWCGIIEIADKLSISKKLSRIFSPILTKIFYNLDSNSKEINAISMNICANLLGIGNAATPLGIMAMKSLNENSTATNKENSRKNMTLFVLMNTSCFTLIPSTIANIRVNFGSKTPFDIIIFIWISSFFALFCGLFFAKLYLNGERLLKRRT